MSEVQESNETNGAGSKEQVLADLAAERERRKAAEAALAELQETHRVKVEELSGRATAAEAALADATVRADRFEILRSKGVPSQLDDFITGSTAEEIAASAQKALDVFNANQPAADAAAAAENSKPFGMRPDMSQGAAPVALNGDALEAGLRTALNI